MAVNSRKRKDSITNIDYTSSKRPCLEHKDLQDESKQDLPNELDNSHETYTQHQKIVPQKLIALIYRLQLSALCSIRTIQHKLEYNLMTIAIEDFEIDTFSDIVIHYNNNSVRIHIEYEDNYIDSNINYSKLFVKKGHFSVNNYFESFVKHEVLKADKLQNKLRYLIIYTNLRLDLTEDLKLNQNRSRNFYPFQFNRIDMEKHYVLKDILYTSDPTKEHDFYQFVQEDVTRAEFIKRLKLSAVMQNTIKERGHSEKYERKIKEKFFKKLVFAVHQPNRQELKYIIQNEMQEQNYKDYLKLQELMLNKVKASGKIGNTYMYEFNLLLSTLHDMFLHKKISFMYYNNNGSSNSIAVSYKNKITFIKAYNTNINIRYSHLFTSVQQKDNGMFSINKHFACFLEELEKNKNLKFFILYTNTNIDLEKENRLKKGKSKSFLPFKLEVIDIQKKKFKLLRYCSSIENNGLYQFVKNERILVLNRIKFPSSVQKKQIKLFDESEEELKEKFLHMLIFATNQPNMEELNRITINNIKRSDVPYTYEELHEIALRSFESNKFDSITEQVMRVLLNDIKNSSSSYRKTENENISEEIKLAKSVNRSVTSSSFNPFLWFLTKGEGRKILEHMNNSGINVVNISSIISGSGSRGAKTLKDLHNLWFDDRGNETIYLKTLQENRIKIATLSNLLSGSKSEAASAFENLFHLWFNEEGKKTQYLKTFEKESVSLSNISCIVSGAGSQAPKAFKDLYDLWFDEQGNKTQYLKSLEDNNINLSSMSSILRGTGSNAAKAFKDLYRLWFNEKGNKTQYLKSLEDNNINLSSMSTILGGARSNAAKAFKILYDIWIDEEGNKTQYLKMIKKEGINLTNVSSILNGAGSNSANCFKNLYNLWFDEEGNKTHYLISLEKEGLSVASMTSILSGAGSKTSEAFKDLFHLWFDQKGHKTKFLKTPEENGIDLRSMTTILSGAGYHASKAFNDLYDLWFDEEGKKTHYLISLEEEGLSVASMTSILSGAGSKTSEAFKDLFDLWFDQKGHKTKFLKTLQENDINLRSMTTILSKSGSNAAQAFRSLYNVWFNEVGKKTKYLKTFEENGISLVKITNVLIGAGYNAANAFRNLYDLWFDKERNLTHYAKTLQDNGVNLSTMCTILYKAGNNVANKFLNLYEVWFDEQGNKTVHFKCSSKK